MAVKAVVFDVGETLVDETRVWTLYAGRAGISPLVFFAALGALIERRDDHRNVFELLEIDPSIDSLPYERDDLYGDVAGCLTELRRRGYALGLAGNQPARTEGFLRECGLDVDFIASSEGWGVHKPSPEFFARVLDACACKPGEVAYVGDRVDNDVIPAAAAGMVAVFIRRGPWGWLQSQWPEAAQADVTVTSLAELPEALSDV